MKNYCRVMLGRKSAQAPECFPGGFIGVELGIREDLSRKLPEEWGAFNKQFIPVFLAHNPGKFKIGAGVATGPRENKKQVDIGFADLNSTAQSYSPSTT